MVQPEGVWTFIVKNLPLRNELYSSKVMEHLYPFSIPVLNSFVSSAFFLYTPTIFSSLVWALEYGLKPFLQPLPDDITCRACINAETV